MNHDADRLILGLDVGGSTTRAALADLTGSIRGVATGPGGNPITCGIDAAVASMREAILGAAASDRTLPGAPPADLATVVAVVVGTAGHTMFDDPKARDVYDRAMALVGVRPRPTIIGDALPAFHSASISANGTVLLAGTGAAAHEISAGAVVRTADGYGPLLGDDGSGNWIGRQAVRAVLGQLRGLEPRTTLTAPVLDHWDVTTAGRDKSEVADRLISAVSDHPGRLAQVATCVVVEAAGEDLVATDICRHAAHLLAGSVHAIRSRADRGPIVVNGSLARDPGGPIGTALRDRLRDAGEVRASDNGVVGALWLAAREYRPDTDPHQLGLVHDQLIIQLSDGAAATDRRE